MIEGIGNQVIGVPLDKIRLLGDLPSGVEVVAAIPPRAEDRWHHPQCVFLHIRHRLCFRQPDNGLLCIERIEAFLARFQELIQEGQ